MASLWVLMVMYITQVVAVLVQATLDASYGWNEKKLSRLLVMLKDQSPRSECRSIPVIR